MIVVLLLFGGKKIPELMRGLGKGVKGIEEDLNTDKTKKTEAPEKDNDKTE